MQNKKGKTTPESRGMTRRAFIGNSTAGAAAFMIVPRHVLGGTGYKAPSDMLNIACIGVGGKGFSDIAGVGTENIVALVDVDDTQMARTLKRDDEMLQGKLKKAKKYRDFRVMLEEHKNDVDAVTVTTPDHTHAAIAMAAMQMGKHAFVQKPLTYSVAEARALAEAAKKYKVMTQMGNQGHAREGGRLVCEWIWDGAIGPVREVHCWTNRPIWPQGIDAPKEIPTTPSTFDWDLWLGPAPYRPYHPAYAPFSWRGWRDFGTGALGDMGAHIFDHPYWALKLDLPTSVQASSTRFTKDSYPVAEKVNYEFPARGDMPPVALTWYDGGLMPDRPDSIEQGRKLGSSGGGCLFVGEKGELMCSVYGDNPRLIPETKMKAYERPEKTIPRSPGIHQEWVAACKGEGETTSHFGYSARLTETMLLGNIAVFAQDKNVRLEYDGDKMEFTNLPEANQYLSREYRPGWSLT